jgi:D-serine deaminase-like pyridoxal phosphate-dependent protein
VGATQWSRQSPERNRDSGSSAVAQPINSALVAGLGDVVLGWRHKAAPAAAHGQTAAAFIGSGAHLSDFQTPLLTLDAAAMTANLDRLAHWCADKGVLLAPHGKTTMAPQLWRDQLERGAWGITLANAAQLRVARAFGVRRVQLANSLTDPRAIMWLAAEQGPDFSVVSWVDSLQTVELLEQTLEAAGTVLDVLVELGGAGGRTGARTVEAAVEIAGAVSAAAHLRLVGVAGYEGSLAHTADADGLAAVRGYLSRLKETHRILLAGDLYAAGVDIIVTAGGSAYFDDVVDVLADCVEPGTQRVDVIIRSGAYVVHDDGFYRTISPFSRTGNQPFRSAMHAWARVVSQPEPGLALLDAGKRDLPVDEGLPEPQALGQILGGALEPLAGASITAVNDQHSYLRFDPATTTVNIGDVVRLGLSHPCTAFDKWTLIPVLADTHADQRVAGLIHTFF